MKNIEKHITDYKYSAEMIFHIPNTVRLLGDFTFERQGSSIYWPFGEHCLVVNKNLAKIKKIPLKINKTCFILLSSVNLKVKDSKEFFTQRIQECDKALNIIQKKKNIDSITELSLQNYREIEHFIPNPILRKRTYHIVSEQYRVNEAVKAIKKDNHILFGKLLKASNASFVEYYDFFDEEVKKIFDLLKGMNILGYRMLAGHHFGNILCLVENKKVDQFKLELLAQDGNIKFSEIKDA